MKTAIVNEHPLINYVVEQCDPILNRAINDPEFKSLHSNEERIQAVLLALSILTVTVFESVDFEPVVIDFFHRALSLNYNCITEYHANSGTSADSKNPIN